MRSRLQRAGIALHTGVRLERLEGATRVDRALARPIAGAGAPLEFEVDAVVVGNGFAPATELAALIGAPMSLDAATGHPAPLRDEDGKSGDLPLWIAGDSGGSGGSVVAMAEGRIAGAAMLRFLGRDRPAAQDAEPRARRDLARARSFQAGLWSLFAAPAALPPAGETLVCRCENVAASTIAACRADGVRDLASLKRLTRLGMGRCQGRYCVATARALIADPLRAAAKPDLVAPQAPVKPTPAILLAREKPEWGGHREVPLQTRGDPSPTADPVPDRCDVVIIGAGVIGASTAMYAAADGLDTVVIDRLQPNSEASGGNAGSLHVQLLSWDFGAKAMAGGHPALQTLPLQRDGVALWKALESELGDFEIVTTGGLMVAEDDSQAVFLQHKAEAERRAGIEVEVLGRAELAALAPAISERMRVAAYCAAEGKINPLKATPALVEAAKRKWRPLCRRARGRRRRSASSGGYVVTTGKAKIAARQGGDRVRRLVSSGRATSGASNCRSPARRCKCWSTESTRPMLRQLIAHADRHLTMKQATSGNLIIGGAWPAGTDRATGYARVARTSIEGNLWVAERTAPFVGGLHLLRSWAAMSVNIDGAPLLGEIPGRPGVFVAATANGYTLGPIVGRATADLLKGRPRPDLNGFTLHRFG